MKAPKSGQATLINIDLKNKLICDNSFIYHRIAS